MAITYDAPSNKITITGYTEGTPCNFTDLYNADKGGALSLHARTGITGTDGAAVAVDRAEKPTDYVVLGGASNDLYITIANWVGTTATIQITGTNRDGAAQTEDIVVTANGTYYTTRWFKTITHTQVTVFTATSFDYDLTQGQWGVISKQGALEFKLDCDLQINTWLADINKQITVEKVSGRFFMNSDGVLKLGTKVSDYVGKEGCTLYFTSPNTHALYFSSGRLLWYDSVIRHGSTYIGATANLVHEMIGCIAKDSNLLRWKGANSIIYHLTYHGGTTYGLNPMGTLKILEDVLVQNRQYGFYFYVNQGSSTIKDLRTLNVTTGIMALSSTEAANHAYMINCVLENWNITWSGSAPNTKIYRQYTFNLKVLDKDGNNINDATVKVWDKDNNLVVDTTTTNGVIAEQTLSYGYYDQAHLSVLQSYSPHKIQIRKAGTNYLTYEKKFTLDEKIDWRIAMVDVSDIVNGITDIKGTGFVKDTDSLVDIRPETDKIQTGIIDTPNNFKADVTNLDVAVSTRSSPSDVLADTNKKVPADLEDVPTDSELDASHGSGSWEGASASSVASAVWDEDLSGHTTPSTAGKIVSTIKKIVSFIRTSK